MIGRVTVKHVHGCSAVALVRKGDWTTAWYVDSTTRWADKNGSTHGNSYRFLVLKCNSTDCPAEALLKEEAVLQLFDSEVKGNDRVTRQAAKS